MNWSDVLPKTLENGRSTSSTTTTSVWQAQQKTVDYVYSLPYSKTKHFRCLSPISENSVTTRAPTIEYAIDFTMPEGTEILASRPGVVISCKDESTVGGPTRAFIDKQNFVVIKHGDGTYASYDHLKPGGLLVRIGQKVSAGKPIGLSGNTGMSAESTLAPMYLSCQRRIQAGHHSISYAHSQGRTKTVERW